MLIGYSYIFLCEKSFQIYGPFLNWVVLLFLILSGLWSFVRCMYCSFFLLVCALPIHFLMISFYEQKFVILTLMNSNLTNFSLCDYHFLCSLFESFAYPQVVNIFSVFFQKYFSIFSSRSFIVIAFVKFETILN